jgi:thioredoxin reductase/bacterioferritin-associated ferredoxin
MNTQFDVVVLGGGPAGGNAALETALAGLSTLIVEEQSNAGGQVWRAKSAAIRSAPRTTEGDAGGTLRADLAKSQVQIRLASRVWHIERPALGTWRLDLVTPTGAECISAKALVLAPGAQERVMPFPGWTTPAVLGLAAATALMKQELMLPGERTVVAGCGPLVFFVASEIMRLGGRPSAVVTLNSRLDWIKALPGLGTRPDLLKQGLAWIARLQASMIPIHWRHTIEQVGGVDSVSSVSVRPVDRAWRSREDALVRVIDADSLVVGHGLVPAVEASRLAGARHLYDAGLGGWIPQTEKDGATSVPGLWVCGDAAGILGSTCASLQGSLTGLSVAGALGRANERTAAKGKQLLAELQRANRFGRAAAGLMAMRNGLVEDIAPETVVCRCESVPRAEIEREIAAGVTTINSLKSGTRAGMGACGGRFCGDTVARLIAYRTGLPLEKLEPATARSPLRPMPIGQLAPPIDYDSLPIPGPSPL